MLVDPPGWTIVYTDGAAPNNQNRQHCTAGVGVWWGEWDTRNLSERCPGDQTNNRAELIAIARALEQSAGSRLPLLIRTDSSYSINALTIWVSGWEKRGLTRAGGQSIANLPLIKYVWTLLKERAALGYEWKFEHVEGHAGIHGNVQADALAVRGCELPKLEERDWDADTGRILARMLSYHGGISAQATTQAAPLSSSASVTPARSHQAASATSTATSNTNPVVRTSSGSAWSSVSGAGGPRSPTTPRRQTRTYMVAAPDKWELEYHDNLFMSVEQLNLLAAKGWKHH